MDTPTRIISGLRFGVILMGLIGNAITYIIYSRPVFRKNSISTYCRALALFECFTIVDLIYEYGITFFNTFLANYSDVACVVYYYIGLAFGSIPGWILIAFSVDKLLIMKNIGSSLIKRQQFQYTIIAFIVLINLLLYIKIPIDLRLTTVNMTLNTTSFTYFICDASLPAYTFVSEMYLIEGSLLPFLIMFTTSIISIWIIRKSSRTLSKRQTALRRNSRFKRDARFAVTSIAFNFMFIVLKLPVVLLVVLMNFISTLSPNGLELQLTYLVYFLNFSLGIIVHLVSNNLFRREFLLLFRF